MPLGDTQAALAGGCNEGGLTITTPTTPYVEDSETRLNRMIEEQKVWRQTRPLLVRNPDGGFTVTNRQTGEVTIYPPMSEEEKARRRRGAEILREWQSFSPFFFERAQKAFERGGPAAELEYWLGMHSSCVNLKWPPLPPEIFAKRAAEKPEWAAMMQRKLGE
jgi:PAS domain-containing protein